MSNTVFMFQLQRRGSTLSSLPSIGRLGCYEVKGLLLCFLHIVKTVSEGQYHLHYMLVQQSAKYLSSLLISFNHNLCLLNFVCVCVISLIMKNRDKCCWFWEAVQQLSTNPTKLTLTTHLLFTFRYPAGLLEQNEPTGHHELPQSARVSCLTTTTTKHSEVVNHSHVCKSLFKLPYLVARYNFGNEKIKPFPKHVISSSVIFFVLFLV